MTFGRRIDGLFKKTQRSKDLLFIPNGFFDDKPDGLVGLPDEGRPTRPP